MSHDATNWAIKQRGIRPALKVVLWNLCDRYHPDNGCFPSQETLAADCEVPRSTLNTYLNELETAGLIAREQRREKGSNRQERTRYRFPFEPDFPEKTCEKPCPETGHGAESRNAPEPSPENGESRVQNLDSNPVREPVRETSNERERARSDRDEIRELERRHDALRIGRNGNAWPDVLNQSKDWSFRQFAALAEEDRLLAEEYRDAYLAACPKLKTGKRKGETDAQPLGVYFRDKLFRDVRAMAVKRPVTAPVATDNEAWAVAYGPVHAAMLFRILLDGPERPDMTPDNGLWLSSLLRSAWPQLAAFWQQTDMKRGLHASDVDRSLATLMEFIPTKDRTWEEWQREFKRRRLPSIRRPDGMDGLYFPVGGPDGLYDFEARLREVRGDEHAA